MLQLLGDRQLVTHFLAVLHRRRRYELRREVDLRLAILTALHLAELTPVTAHSVNGFPYMGIKSPEALRPEDKRRRHSGRR